MAHINKLIDEFNLKQKKIIFCDIFDPIPIDSGGDWYRYYIIDELSNNNDFIHMYTSVFNKKGYTPKKINFQRKHIKGGTKLNTIFNLISPKIELIKLEFVWNRSELKNIDADLIITPAETYHIARYLSKRNNAPIILIMHNLEWDYLKNIGSKFYIPMWFYENYLIRKVDGIIAISSREMEYVSKKTTAKVFHIPPKLYPIFNSEGEKFEYGNDKLNVLFYGSLNNPQNVDALQFIIFELIPLLKIKKLMNKVRINIFGSGKPPHNLDNNPDINYIGTVDDPGKFIRGADVVIVPLKNSAGIKIRIIESLGCKKPVIATPEAVLNLQEHLKEEVIIKETAAEFVEVIENFIKDFYN